MLMSDATWGAGKRLPAPGLYAVTPDEADTTRLIALVTQVVAGRPALLQYRSKLDSAAVREVQARAILAICRSAGVPLIINDDLQLALAIGADGVHLGRDDGDPAHARAALGASGIVGVTCYDEWARAQAGVQAGADYVAFGAMFVSPTKPHAVRAPLALLRRARQELGVPVAAIGGITLDNVDAVIAAGADFPAVISDVFLAPDPAARVRSFAAKF